MSIACKVTVEQKKFLFENYRELLTEISGFFYAKISNDTSKPNVYISHYNTLSQTSREPSDYDAKHYFVWVDFDVFQKKLMNLLIIKKKIKL